MNPHAKSPQPGVGGFVWCVLLVLSACVVVLAFRTRQCFVDDAFIGFQYLRNLLAGEGFVFCPGDAPVEGVSNIGWLLLLAPLSIGGDPAVTAKLVGLALVLLTLILTVGLGRVLAAKMAPAEDLFGLVVVPALILAASFSFVYFSLAGMETALLATILMSMACVVLHRPCSTLLPVLGATAFLVHPEAVAVYPLYVAPCWLRSKEDRRKLVAGGLIFAGLLGGVTAVRLWYFHDVVPNTFHSKPSSLALVIRNGYGFLMGRNANVAFPITGWLAIPVLVLGYLRLRRAAPAAAGMLAAICGAGLVFAIYSPPDWTNLPRYFAPYLPAALILLWAGVGKAIARLCSAGAQTVGIPVGVAVVLQPQRTACGSTTAAPTASGAGAQARTRQTIAALAALALVLTCVFDSQARLAQMDVFPGYVLAGENLVGPAVWMRDHLPPEATIATRRIGALAYYSRRQVFDYAYGLPDPKVARLVGRLGRRFDTPTDGTLAALWHSRAPDYLLEDGAMIDFIVAQAGGVRRRFAIHGIEYGVVREFPIGCGSQWVLAQRIGP
jgi:hypothetical protein